MNLQILDPLLILVLLLNFAILATSSLRIIIFTVAAQGFVLAALYPIAHGNVHPHPEEANQILDLARLYGLTAVMAVVKGIVIPWLLLKAMREADVPHQIDPIGGLTPTLIVAAFGTALLIIFAKSLTLHEGHRGGLIVPSALASVFSGFLLLSLRREVLTQVIGYLVLENGIFIFGLLLVTAIPIMVELGVLLDLFVGVFVMGILVNHVSRALPSASTEHMTSLRE
jgi:hydrogenase-4 component E